MAHRALAFVVSISLALGATNAGADWPVAEMKLAAPEKYSPLVWKFGEKLSPGFWYTSDQVLVINRRIDFLETKAAKECVDAQIQSAKAMPKWIYITSGILAGAAVGFCVGHSNHCGIGK